MKLLITGHSSLFSRAMALSRLNLGDEVFMTSRSDAKAFDERIKILPYDFSSPDVTPFMNLKLDGVILSAMSETPALKKFHKLSLDDQDQLTFIRENIEGNVRLLQAILPGMVERKFGRLVYISSMIAVHPMSGYSTYGMIKSCLESMMKSIAFEYGENNITSNVLRPGILATDRNAKFRKRFEGKLEERISLKKIATPEQITEAIHPLLSKDCYIQGEAINVSGGLFVPN